MSNLQTYYNFKLDFQKVHQHTGGKWLIYGTKRRKEIYPLNNQSLLLIILLAIFFSFVWVIRYTKWCFPRMNIVIMLPLGDPDQ